MKPLLLLLLGIILTSAGYAQVTTPIKTVKHHHDTIRVVKPKPTQITGVNRIVNMDTVSSGVIVPEPLPTIEKHDTVWHSMDVIDDVSGMLAENIYTTTNSGELLSSQLVATPKKMDKCTSDTLVWYKIPVAKKWLCKPRYLQVYRALKSKDGKTTWELANQSIRIDSSAGQPVFIIGIKDVCTKLNFAYQLDECHDLVEVELRFKGLQPKKILAILKSTNTISEPVLKKNNTYKILVKVGEQRKLALNMTVQPTGTLKKKPVLNLTQLPMGRFYHENLTKSISASERYYLVRRKDFKQIR